MILDTAFLIDLIDGDEGAVAKLKELIDKRTPLTIASPTVFELFTGIEQYADPGEETERVHQILHQQPRWPFDDASAETAGRIHGSLKKRGRPIGAVDAMIAGIAIQHNEAVLTRNVDEFKRVPGLRVESY